MFILRFILIACIKLVRGFWLTARWLRPFIFNRPKRSPREVGSHGTARFASKWELLRSGVLGGVGPIIGKGPWGRLIRFTSDGLVFVFASTGAGKGIGVVCPTLLSYPGSILVTDPKSENFSISQKHRRKLGPVFMMSPTNLAASARLNPMDCIRKGTPIEVDDCRTLADLMSPTDANDVKHWNEKSTSVLAALILHTLYEQDDGLRTLAHVCNLVSGSPDAVLDTIRTIAAESPSPRAAALADSFLSSVPRDGNFPPELLSVISNLQKATGPWAMGTPAGILSSYSTFKLSDLTDQVCTLYLCVDEELISVYSRWMRVMTGSAINMIMRAKAKPAKGHKVILLLDEVARLGALEPLETNAGLLRTYATPVLIWQSMLQAEAIYGEKRAAALMANASCRVFFGVNDNDTASYVAQMVGNTTTLSRSSSVSQSSEAWLRQNQSNSQSESGYWLLDPSEVQRLPVTRLIVKFRDMEFSALATRLDYRKVWAWRGRWGQWRNGETLPPSDGLPPPGSPRQPVPLHMHGKAQPEDVPLPRLSYPNDIQQISA